MAKCSPFCAPIQRPHVAQGYRPDQLLRFEVPCLGGRGALGPEGDAASGGVQRDGLGGEARCGKRVQLPAVDRRVEPDPLGLGLGDQQRPTVSRELRLETGGRLERQLLGRRSRVPDHQPAVVVDRREETAVRAERRRGVTPAPADQTRHRLADSRIPQGDHRLGSGDIGGGRVGHGEQPAIGAEADVKDFDLSGVGQRPQLLTGDGIPHDRRRRLEGAGRHDGSVRTGVDKEGSFGAAEDQP